MSTAAVGRDKPSRGLFERWQRDKDPRARERLVECYLPLARKLAGRYRDRAGEAFDDLLQVASLGLLNAIDRFDPGRGTAFSSFAVPTILGQLKRHFRDTGWSAHVPRGAQELALKVQAAEQADDRRATLPPRGSSKPTRRRESTCSPGTLSGCAVPPPGAPGAFTRCNQAGRPGACTFAEPIVAADPVNVGSRSASGPSFECSATRFGRDPAAEHSHPRSVRRKQIDR